MECWMEEGSIEEERYEEKKCKNVEVIEGWRSYGSWEARIEEWKE